MPHFLTAFLFRSRLRKVILTTALLSVLLFLVLPLTVEFKTTDLALKDNLVVMDRAGQVLQTLPDTQGERHEWVSIDQVPERLIQAFIAAEDERFYFHPGFDPWAIIRATFSNLWEGRIVSGASTLTQQMVRLVYARPRTFSGKVSEISRALKAEWHLSKAEILEQYLNRVPLGNNLMGVGIASQVYFGKPVSSLNTTEMATLAALPKAPGRLSPYRPDTHRLVNRRNWVLGRMCGLGYLTEEECQRSQAQALEVTPKRFSFEAPHLVNMLIERGLTEAASSTLQTTLDSSIQSRLQTILLSHRSRLLESGATQAAAMVVGNRGNEVLALVGSLEYSEKGLGFNNGVKALRSPGSALKPFLYGLALDQGYTAATLLEDTRRRYRSARGEYYPRNFNREEYGPTTIRTALGNSLNLSAIRMIGRVGFDNFFHFLEEIQLINTPEKGSGYYGLGLAIGNLEVSLEQLVTAYAMLAHDGDFTPLRYLTGAPLEQGQRVLSEQACFIIRDILADPSSRLLTFGGSTELDFPYRVAWKTGTSTHYRDSWILGLTPDYTVGVWVGNFSGEPMSELGGATGAGPIFADLFKFLYRDSSPGSFPVPEGVVQEEVCGYSGMMRTTHCPTTRKEWFIEGSQPRQECTFHRQEGLHHDLETPYAGWLYDREQEGLSAPYRLAGLSGSELFSDPEEALEEQGLRSTNASTSVSQPTRRSVIEITYPAHGDRLLLNRSDQRNQICFEATVSGPPVTVTWLVDGVEYSQTGPPYRAYWRMEKGEHRIAAVCEGSEGDEINIQVE
jgi:penicillin-binding protein 1C